MKMKCFFRSNLLLVSISFVLIFPLFLLKASEPEIGKVYSGFKLLKKQPVKEINGTGLLFEHLKSGARLLKISTNDENNLFAIGFKTPQSDDTGLPHILEHCVLNGSRKFPVKSPFDVLKQGSLNTFLNALTSDDNTVYPVASRNDKDFFNLMDVYLDAVLFPGIYQEPRIFYREGWHHQLDSPEAELKINGIVYNEMKGYYSDPRNLLNLYLNKSLFPENCYGYDPGGVPEAIPTLTQEIFLEFHKTYYHPSNAYLYLEGDGDVVKELEFIDHHYLSRFERRPVDSFIPLQKPFGQRKEITVEYPVSENEDETGKTWLVMGFVAGESASRDLTMTLDVLADVLMNLPAAPLRRALMDAGIGQDVFANLTSNKQNRFDLGVKNARLEDRQRFDDVIRETLKKLVENGIDKKMIEGVINRLEFKLREGPRSGFPKALENFYDALNTWLYSGNPFAALEYEEPLGILKKGLKTGYFEKTIDKYLLKNPHCVLMIMKPKKGMTQEQEEILKQKLEATKSSLSSEQAGEIVAQTRYMKEYQETPDSPEALKTIPLLSLGDVNPEAEKLDLRIENAGNLNVMFYPAFTGGIVYLRLIFDSSAVPQDLIPYTALLGMLLGEMDTRNYAYGDLDTQINLHTGGITFEVDQFVLNQHENNFMPVFKISAKVLTEKFAALIGLIDEMVNRTSFSNRARLKELILQHSSRLQSQLSRAGHIYAYRRMASYLNGYRKYQELTGGLSYNRFVSQLAKDFEDKAEMISANLKKTIKFIFNRQNLRVGLVCSEENYRQIKSEFSRLLDLAGNETPPRQAYEFSFEEKNEGLQSASRVQYVFQGYNFKDLGFRYSGKFQVLAQILRRGYLHEEIRIKGGAYGRFMQFGRFGMGFFGSYSDPHLERTLKVFQGIPEHLKNFQADETEMTRFILGTISYVDYLLEPEEKGDLAISRYLQQIAHTDIQNERDEILSTTAEDIRNFAPMIARMLEKNVFCVFGNEQKIEENKTLFNKLVKTTE